MDGRADCAGRCLSRTPHRGWGAMDGREVARPCALDRPDAVGWAGVERRQGAGRRARRRIGACGGVIAGGGQGRRPFAVGGPVYRKRFFGGLRHRFGPCRRDGPVGITWLRAGRREDLGTWGVRQAAACRRVPVEHDAGRRACTGALRARGQARPAGGALCAGKGGARRRCIRAGQGHRRRPHEGFRGTICHRRDLRTTPRRRRDRRPRGQRSMDANR